jgi:hypothetical protein
LPRRAKPLGLRLDYTPITPQKNARPLLSLMHASDESQLPGLWLSVNAASRQSQ